MSTSRRRWSSENRQKIQEKRIVNRLTSPLVFGFMPAEIAAESAEKPAKPPNEGESTMLGTRKKWIWTLAATWLGAAGIAAAAAQAAPAIQALGTLAPAVAIAVIVAAVAGVLAWRLRRTA